MRIIITNDDGVRAEGPRVLASELSSRAKVIAVAPDRDQSGTGTLVTLRQPLRITSIDSPLRTVSAYCVKGTPADSIILAINAIVKDKKIDFVVSGINEGPNLGDDVFISGTVGAALQGYPHGIPSIALSTAGFGELHFEIAARLARILISSIMMDGFDHQPLFNINLPNLELRALKGIEMTRPGERRYADRIESRYHDERDYYWVMRDNPEWHAVPGRDIWAIKQDMISITPFPIPDMRENMTRQEFFQQLAIQAYHKLLNEGAET